MKWAVPIGGHMKFSFDNRYVQTVRSEPGLGFCSHEETAYANAFYLEVNKRLGKLAEVTELLTIRLVKEHAAAMKGYFPYLQVSIIFPLWGDEKLIQNWFEYHLKDGTSEHAADLFISWLKVQLATSLRYRGAQMDSLLKGVEAI